MKYLWRAFKLILPYRGMLLLFLVASIFNSILGGLPLVLIKNFLDFLQDNNAHGDRVSKWINDVLSTHFGTGETYLYWLCGIVVLMLPIAGATDFLVSYLSGWFAQRIRNDAMVKLMKHMLWLDIGFFGRTKMGDLVSRMVSDTASLRATVKLTLDFLQQPPKIVVFMCLAIYYDWFLFLVGAFLLPVIVGPMVRLTQRVIKQSRKVRDQAAGMAQEMLQNLNGIRIVQAYGAEAAESENFERMSRKMFRTALKRNISRALQQPITSTVLGIGMIGVLLIGGLRIFRGETDVESFIAFCAALGLMMQPIRSMIKSLGEIGELIPSAERTFQILEVHSTIQDAPDAVECPRLQTSIIFENVKFDYGRETVFEKLNLTIKAGEQIGIVGRTGVGKSTLLSLLLRFYDPNEGRILLDGVEIKKVKLASLRRQIALVTQDPFLFHASIEENIRYGRPDATMEEIVAAAKAAAVYEEIERLPEGFNTSVGEAGASLSGGQRQRIAVARAILRNAPILLLDEATSALDSSSEKRLQAALDSLLEKRTALIVAHRLSTLRNTDRIVVFGDGGGIEAVASHEELLKISPTYQRLWKQQMEAGEREDGIGNA